MTDNTAPVGQLALDLSGFEEDWHVWFVSLPAGVYSSARSVRTSYARLGKRRSHAVAGRSWGQRIPRSAGVGG